MSYTMPYLNFTPIEPIRDHCGELQMRLKLLVCSVNERCYDIKNLMIPRIVPSEKHVYTGE